MFRLGFSIIQLSALVTGNSVSQINGFLCGFVSVFSTLIFNLIYCIVYRGEDESIKSVLKKLPIFFC